MGNIVPEAPPKGGDASASKLLVFDTMVEGFEEPLKLLVDSGASENFVRKRTVSQNANVSQKVRPSGRQLAVRLATGMTVREPESTIDLKMKFLDFDCIEQFIVLDMDTRYDLILGFPWLQSHEPWIDWRERTMASSSPALTSATRDRVAYGVISTPVQQIAAVDISTKSSAHEDPPVRNIFVGSSIALCPQGIPSSVLRRRRGKRNGASIVSDISDVCADNSQSRSDMVTGTDSDMVTGTDSDMVTELGTTQKELNSPDASVFAEEHRGAELSSSSIMKGPPSELPKTGKEICNLPELAYPSFLALLSKGGILELAVPTPVNELELNSSSNADESVVETDRQKRFQAQSLEALKDSPVYPLVCKYTDIGPEDTPAGLPSAKGVEHEIDTEPGSGYCTTRQWPLPPEQVEFIDKFFANKLRQGLVRESNSPHSSPTFCVRKATGGWRVVHAYNKLNATTIPAQTPIPRKDVIIDSMAGSEIFSCLDLKDGFYQILMREKDIPYTAVSTPSGMLWEWLVMPQGLKNAPATFNRLVQNVMREHRAYAPSYFDDIFIHSRAEGGKTALEMHLHHLELVFATLRKYKLYINLKKCVFCVDEIPVLGCYVGKDGVRADPEKVQAVANWPVPKDVKSLRKWLGLANYMHKYSQNYALLAKPLSDLLKKDLEWEWTHDCQKAFDAIKQSLIEAPILALPDHTRPFSVVCDASDFAIGCALLQHDADGRDRVISYQSRQLRAAELNYPVHDKELLAIKYALLKFRVYLLGAKPFVVYTDHASLRTAINSPHLSQRMARWLAFFAEYNFRVEYKPGKQNVLADALSRRPDYEVSRSVLEVAVQAVRATAHDDIHLDIHRISVATVSNTLRDEIIAGYARDTQCRELIEFFVGDSPTLNASLRAKAIRFNYSDGLLWHQISDCDYPRVFIPAITELRERILSEHHDLPHAGHFGREKTYLSICAHFYWPHLFKWVTNYVKACEVCQRVKPAPHSQAPLRPLPVPADCWKDVSLDFIFGFPSDKTGNTGVAVFTDRLGKMVHMAPVRESITAKQTAQLFLDRIFMHHGLPETLVSDRDPRFTAHFWRELFQLLGTRLAMSTSAHPQTDGQTERANRVIEDILRSFCAANPSQWSSLLPMVEFAINNSVHSSHGYTPFYVNGLRHPRVPSSLLGVNVPLGRGRSSIARDHSDQDLDDPKELAVSETALSETDEALGRKPVSPKQLKEVNDFVALRASVIQHVRHKMAEAQERQKYHADKHGRRNENRFEVGEKVLLSVKNLPTSAISTIPTGKQRGGATKLLPRIGPFEILEKIGDVDYRLDIPRRMRLHPTFYVGLLKPYLDPEKTPIDPLKEDCGSNFPHTGDDSPKQHQELVDQQLQGESPSSGHVPPTHMDIPSKADTSQGASAPCTALPTFVEPPTAERIAHRDSSTEFRDISRELPSALPSATPGHSSDVVPTCRNTLVRTSDRGNSDLRRSRAGYRQGIRHSSHRTEHPGSSTHALSRYTPPPLLDQHGYAHWVVDRLLEEKRVGKSRYYLVKWKGFPHSENTWESQTQLEQDIPDMLAAFQRSVSRRR